VAHPPAVKGPGRETDLLFPPSADIRNAGNYMVFNLKVDR